MICFPDKLILIINNLRMVPPVYLSNCVVIDLNYIYLHDGKFCLGLDFVNFWFAVNPSNNFESIVSYYTLPVEIRRNSYFYV